MHVLVQDLDVLVSDGSVSKMGNYALLRTSNV